MAHLEYGSVVWDPHLFKDKTAIENVHKFALRVCSKQWRASYESLLTTFHGFSMSERSIFNMVKGNILLPSFPLQPKNILYAVRYANQHQLTLPLYHTNSFKHSFFLLPSPAGTTSLLHNRTIIPSNVQKTHNAAVVNNYCISFSHIFFPLLPHALACAAGVQCSAVSLFVCLRVCQFVRSFLGRLRV